MLLRKETGLKEERIKTGVSVVSYFDLSLLVYSFGVTKKEEDEWK